MSNNLNRLFELKNQRGANSTHKKELMQQIQEIRDEERREKQVIQDLEFEAVREELSASKSWDHSKFSLTQRKRYSRYGRHHNPEEPQVIADWRKASDDFHEQWELLKERKIALLSAFRENPETLHQYRIKIGINAKSKAWGPDDF